jgi:hypothetical protein
MPVYMPWPQSGRMQYEKIKIKGFEREKHDGGDGTERKRKTRNDGRAGQGRDGPARRLGQREGRGVEAPGEVSRISFVFVFLFMFKGMRAR